jgi:RNA polymerase sigma-70 factor, ECF subfamily
MTNTSQDGGASPDGALIERWQQGDERAATEIVHRHAPALARFAVQLGVRDDVEELVQDTFVRAFNALDGFRADSSLRTWLFTILRRLLIDRRRTTARRVQEVEVADDDAATTYDTLDALMADETSRQIAAAMRRLSPMQRDVFTLRVQEGRNYRDIAEILGTTEGAARVHYHNAMRAVKEALDD